MRALILLLALVFISCNAPTIPETGQHFQLTVNASPSCPKSGEGNLIDRQFTFKIMLIDETTRLTFQMPTRPQVSGPDSGSLTIVITPTSTGVTGSIAGEALTSDGVHDVAFFLDQHQGNARLIGTGDYSQKTFSGTLDGQISMSIFGSSSGGECIAADHTWKLTPLFD